MKVNRLIGIIMLLLQREHVTAPELAERFEVSRRTINRDIEDICKAGIPLVTTQGYGGGVSIAEGYKVSHSFLTEAELQLIFAGLKGLDSVSEQSNTLTLAEKLSSKAVDTDDIIVIDLASHYRKPLTEKIAILRDAIQTRRVVSFRYYYEKGEAQRTIEPYQLMFQWSAWYVWGYCLERQDFRLFKLNRLWHLSSSAGTFTPRPLPEPNLDRYFSESRIHLKAIFEERQKYRLVEEYGIGCCQEVPEGLLFERDFASYSNLREWILSFGGQVEVLEPEQLRVDLLRHAKKMLAAYQEHDI